MKLATALALCFIVAACSSQIAFQPVSTGTYPPSSKVEVLKSDPTDVDVEVLGDLTLKSAVLSQNLIDDLVAEAKSIGADAIVVEVDDRGRGGSKLPMSDALDSSEEGDIRGVDTRSVRIDVRAVKYHRKGTLNAD